MIALEKVVGNRSLASFDVLIIGSGSGGSAVASMLAANGQKVLVLEAGSNYFLGLDDPDPKKVRTVLSSDEIKMMRRKLITPDPRVEPRSFRNSDDEVRGKIGGICNIPKTVGGAAVHADLKAPRFHPMDFRMRTLQGEIQDASFADWPVSYDQMDPFYLWAERAMGVAGKENSNPFEPPRAAPYPMPPGLGMYASLRAAEASARLGYHPFPYPTAVNSRPYDGRPACVDCGFCGDYGCTIHAKGSAAVTTLRRALVSGNALLLTETRAVKLLTNSSGTEITGVEAINPDGARVTFRADRYVLALNSIEDARLLLLSDCSGAGLGNSSGMVGRNLMLHYGTLALGIFDDRLHGHRGRAVTHGLLDFRGTPGDPDHPMGGIVELGTACEPISESLTYAIDMKMRGGQLRSLVEQSPLRDRLMGLLMQGEDAPQFTNRVDLDPEIVDLDGIPVARLTYQNHDYELSARAFYSPKLLQILDEAGAVASFIAPTNDVPESSHTMGTLRMGDDPKASVCGASGRFHDIGNLHAADASLFPTGSGMNPTLTLVALAARVAACMIAPESPERLAGN